MANRVSRISSSDASRQPEVGHTLNLGSDSLNAWVSARQSKINQDIEERQRKAGKEHADPGLQNSEGQEAAGHAPPSRMVIEPDEAFQMDAGGSEEPRLSGESKRIGSQNFDDETPFGDRVAIV